MTTVPSLQKTRKGQKNSSTRYRASSETPDLARKQHTSPSPLLESGEGAGGSYSLVTATPSPTARHRKARLETIYNSHLNPPFSIPSSPKTVAGVEGEWRIDAGLENSSFHPLSTVTLERSRGRRRSSWPVVPGVASKIWKSLFSTTF